MKAKSGNFASKSNMHLTLKFLGETDSNLVPDICARLSEAVAGRRSFYLALGKPGVFDRGVEMILWAGTGGELSELESLWSAVEAAMEPMGFANDPRGYSPHITLARQVRFTGSFDDAAAGFEIDPLGIEVSAIVLMESANINGTLTYVPLKSISLASS